jgi:hypothetical protein
MREEKNVSSVEPLQNDPTSIDLDLTTKFLPEPFTGETMLLPNSLLNTSVTETTSL